MESNSEHFSNQVKDARQVFMGFPIEKLKEPSVVSVGFEKCLPDFKIERESYPQIGKSNPSNQFTTIEFITSGKGHLRFQTMNYQQVVFTYKIDLSQNHEFKRGTDDQIFYGPCTFPSFQIEKLTKEQTNYYQISHHVEIMELFELILGNANSGSKNGLVICNLLAHSLILKVSELSQLRINPPAMGYIQPYTIIFT